ncbi:ATP-binding cassette domain-containing protein [Paramicrobacterium chengjingii]|uniref:Sugar ABC transporter ATP-binding protein n=1 Tax=Paramicrobacterium chengjingii TaxID=2769067 RepID=A0ABX6YHG2_9MICO|nr:ATP-binding cassette domain-containing protein [Microbacterium chengjingii]QPZ37817.1 sugar ABC transporter ATP-binding protein [Microbacterium chengjingii]
MSNNLYEVRGASKRYGSVVALDGVDFGVEAGEVVALVGDNGAGKSTLVKALSGAHKPDSGQMYLDGEEVEWSSPQDALHRGIETLYQDSSLAPHLSVSANVFLGRELKAPGLRGKLGFLAKKKMDEQAHRDLQNAGIAVPASARSVSKLSGGQRQAVAIGRAIAWAGRVIILDEPTNHLGAKQSTEVLEVILKAKANGLGVIFISHTLPHVLEVSDRTVVLRLGRVVANAPTSQFTADSLVKAITGLEEAS